MIRKISLNVTNPLILLFDHGSLIIKKFFTHTYYYSLLFIIIHPNDFFYRIESLFIRSSFLFASIYSLFKRFLLFFSIFPVIYSIHFNSLVFSIFEFLIFLILFFNFLFDSLFSFFLFILNHSLFVTLFSSLLCTITLFLIFFI